MAPRSWPEEQAKEVRGRQSGETGHTEDTGQLLGSLSKLEAGPRD